MSAKAQDPAVWDVLIIGGGTAGLAVAARLREHSPTDLFTDEEHRRMHHYHYGGHRRQRRHEKKELSTLVLDAHGSEWMARWNTLFETYNIEHLRSPMFFHVDPSDRDSLLAMTNHPVDNRAHELIELHGCVGKESLTNTWERRKKKTAEACGGAGRPAGTKRPNNNPEVDERDRKDFFTPSTRLFWDHCKSVVQRYGLEGMVRQDEVANITYAAESLDENGDGPKIFTVTAKSGARYRARTVVSAIGYGLKPNYPTFISLPTPKQVRDAPQMTHNLRIGSFPDKHVRSLMAQRRTTNVLVIGGGLTSAQLSDLAVRRGVSKVWHLMRGPLRVKPFDLDISWLGKYRNHAFSEFWAAEDPEDRLAMFHAARQGGSLTPIYYKRVCEHVRRGRIELRTNTRVIDMVHDPETHKWRATTEPPVADMPEFDWVYLATGPSIDVQTLPFLQDMRRDHPAADCGGMPCVNARLMWRDDVPLFFNGRLAGLQLGPGSPNLVGARAGAERVADAIHRLLGAERERGSQLQSRRGRGGGEKNARSGWGGRRGNAAWVRDVRESPSSDESDDHVGREAEGNQDGQEGDQGGRLDYIMGIGSKYGMLCESAE